MEIRNRYVTVIVDGKMDTWTGSSDTKCKKLALERARFLQKNGHNAYAVEIVQIYQEDVMTDKEKEINEITIRLNRVYGENGDTYPGEYDQERDRYKKLTGKDFKPSVF